MQQQSSTAKSNESAAAFYAKLVDVPVSNIEPSLSWKASQTPGSADANDDRQQQYQHQPTTEAAAAAAAAAAGSMPFKPVKFAQPVVLDPNTGVVTLPPRHYNAAAGVAAVAEAAAEPLQHLVTHVRPPTTHQGGRRHSRQSTAYFDLSNHTNRYHTNSRDHHAASTQPATHPAAPSAFGASSKQPVARSNVGYQLLQKAGWQEGRGLGRDEQGNTAPLQVQPQKGNRGLGFASQQQQQQQQQAAAAADNTVKQAAAAAAAAGIGPVLGTKRVAALVAEELAKEDLETKVKRHKQVMQQEAEDIKGKAIQEYLRRAFNEPSMADIRSDSNPLQRSNRLRATNPLLDSDDE